MSLSSFHSFPLPFWKVILKRKQSDNKRFRIRRLKVLVRVLPPKPFHKVQHCHFSNCKISSSFPKLGEEIVKKKSLYVIPYVLTLSLRTIHQYCIESKLKTLCVYYLTSSPYASIFTANFFHFYSQSFLLALFWPHQSLFSQGAYM